MIGRSSLMAALALVATPAATQDRKPVRTADIYVTPYYVAGPAGRRQVRVGATFDALLASDQAADILKARDIVRSRPELVTPMTLMVLSARLYDTGQRDESLFWFYAAKDRYVTLMRVIDLQASRQGEAAAAMNAFNQLLGPVINGYAFCDIARQQAARKRAFDWATANPYQAIFLTQLKPNRGFENRQAGLARAQAEIAAAMAREQAELAKPSVLNQLRQARRSNGADARYCW